MGKRKRDRNDRSGGKKGDWKDDAGGAFNNPFAALAGKTADKPGPAPEATPEEPSCTPEPTTPARAVVRLEKKGRGGKRVTVVSHLGLPAGELAAWCKALRTELGCGGQVEDDTLVIHGDQRDRLIRALEARGVKRVTRS